MERDQKWLEKLFSEIWAQHFHDVAVSAPLQIRFGKKARTRLGSLSYDAAQHLAIIRVTRLFQDLEVPDMVVKATIVHELCHYAHGFNAGTSPKLDHPHKGGVIKQEFAERGLEDLYVAQKRWLKANWLMVIKKHYPHLKFQPRRRRIVRWI